MGKESEAWVELVGLAGALERISPADMVGIALLFVGQSFEMRLDLEADDCGRGIGEVLGERLGVHVLHFELI